MPAMIAAVTSLTAFIIAGGRSSRMGEDKALLLWHGSPLLQHMIAVAGGITTEVRVSGDPAKYAHFATVVPDIFPDSGPLSGIHAALRHTPTQLNLVLAVDMPLIQPSFLQHLVERASATAALITVPHVDGRFQPLCAVYRPPFAELAEEALLQSQNKIDSLFTPDITYIVTQEQIERLAFPLSMFDNLNTRQDFDQAKTRTLADE